MKLKKKKQNKKKKKKKYQNLIHPLTYLYPHFSITLFTLIIESGHLFSHPPLSTPNFHRRTLISKTMDPPLRRSESEWVSTRHRSAAVNRRGGGLEGGEVVDAVDPPSEWVSTRNRPAAGCEVIRRRRRVIRRWGSNSDESPSPPPPPPRIKLPISPGRYGTLRSPPTVRPVSTWTGPPPPREEYVYNPRFCELTPSPPRCDGSVRPPFRLATPQQPTEWPARRLSFSAAPSAEQSHPSVHQPPPSPPPSAVEEEGHLDSDPMSKLHVYYHDRDGFPVYFPFHPTTEEWDACEREADRKMLD